MFVIEISLQAAFARDSSISVSRVSWSPDGNLIGMPSDKYCINWVHICASLKCFYYCCRGCIYKTFGTFVCLPGA